MGTQLQTRAARWIFNYALFDRNLKAEEQEVNNISKTKLPKVTRNVLAPKLMDKIISNSNRIECYVRYDHSQHLDFQGLSPADVEQQLIGDDGTIIPDVMETLPNLKPDQKMLLTKFKLESMMIKILIDRANLLRL